MRIRRGGGCSDVAIPLGNSHFIPRGNGASETIGIGIDKVIFVDSSELLSY